MRPVNLILIHCSASPNSDTLFRGAPSTPSFRNPAQVIDGWHVERGFRRSPEFRARQNGDLSAIGYHFVIARSGLVLTGRHVDEIGAHAKGYNQKSIGICLVGIDDFTAEQWSSLSFLVTAEVARLASVNGPGNRHNPLTRSGAVRLASERGIAICGHRDISPDQNKNGIVEPFEWLKTCPGFDVAAWLAAGMNNPKAEVTP